MVSYSLVLCRVHSYLRRRSGYFSSMVNHETFTQKFITQGPRDEKKWWIWGSQVRHMSISLDVTVRQQSEISLTISMCSMVLEYLPTKLGNSWGYLCRCAYSSTMVRIWDIWLCNSCPWCFCFSLLGRLTLKTLKSRKLGMKLQG